MNSRKIFATALKKLMEKERVSQTEIADMIEVNRANVNRWVHELSIPNPTMIDRICERLGVELVVKFVKKK